MEPLIFISEKILPKLVFDLLKIRKAHEEELTKIGDLFGDPRVLAKYYIEPDCQNVNPADSFEDESSGSITNNAFKIVNKFLNKEIVVRNGASQLFVLSDAGMGKTSLLVMLKLAHLKSFWPKGYDCILMKLGHESITNIKEISNRSKKVLLLDALDEDPTSFGRTEDRIEELLSETKNFYKVVITCRTQYFPDSQEATFGKLGKVSICGYQCPMFYLSYFNNEQVEKYLNKRFPQTLKDKYFRKEKTLFIKAKNTVLKMDSFRFRPLLLAHIEDVIDFSEQEKNEYDIFKALVETWINRESSKLFEQGKKISADDLLLSCTAIAEKMFIGSKSTISKQELKQLTEIKDIRKIKRLQQALSVVDYIDLGGKSLFNKNSEGNYRFAHISIQEFLVVYGIARGIINTENILPRITDNIIRLILLNGENLFPHFNMSSSNLKDLDFSNYNLENTIYKGAVLTGINFEKTKLNNSIFNSARLVGCSFVDAEIDNCNFVQSILSEISFKKIDIKAVYFSGSNLQNSDFNSCNITNSFFPDANARLSNFSFATILESDYRKTNIENSNFSECVISGCDFLKAESSRASFKKTKFDNTSFAYSINKSTDFENCTFKNVGFENSELDGAKFNFCNFSNVNFKSADLKNVDFSSATFLEVDLSGTDLRQSRGLNFEQIKNCEWSLAVLPDNFLGKNGIDPNHNNNVLKILDKETRRRPWNMDS